MDESPFVIGPNPYVGPVEFTVADQDKFYGRSEEIGQLASLVIARQAILFYAQSGAGKTSLINAGLVPRLTARNRMVVLPIARVGGALSTAEGIANVFVFNLLSSLYKDQALPAALGRQTLQEGLAPFLADAESESRPRPRLLIVDQFEELFNQYPERSGERSDFFRQLQESLSAYPRLTLLLSMREDYIPHLDFYTGQMSDRLRSRFRMERLTYEGALEAIKRPAAQAGRRFDNGVAEELANNLRRLQRRQPGEPDQVQLAEAATTVLGDYVEPVHLQIVCCELWDRLPPTQTVVHNADLHAFGDVDEALASFYENALTRAVAATGINQRQLRAWFQEELITPARTRGLLYQGETETEGLPNAVVGVLRDAYIVRGVVRGDDLFVELAHDRLVEPILAANGRWQATYFNPLAEPAQQWITSGRSATQLLRGAEFITAEHFAQEHPGDLYPVEQELLIASRRFRAQRRRILIMSTIAAITLIALIGWAIYANIAAQQANKERQEQQALANARRLANLSVSATDTGFYADGIVRALQAGHTQTTSEAFHAIRHALNFPIRAVHVMSNTEAVAIDKVEFNSDRSSVATIDNGGVLTVWDLNTGQQRFPALQAHDGQAGADNLDWSPDDTLIATGGSRDRTVKIWSATGILLETLDPFPTGVRSVSWNQDGSYLAAVDDGELRVWDRNGAPILTRTGIHTQTIVAEWHPDGSHFLTASRTGLIQIWDTTAAAASPLALAGHTDAVRDVDWHPSRNLLLSGDNDGSVRLWDLGTGTAVMTMTGQLPAIRYVAWRPDGEMFVTIGGQGDAELWRMDTITPSARLVLPNNGRIMTFAWSPGGDELLTGDSNGQVRLWDGTTGAVKAIPISHSSTVEQVRWTADGNRILSAGRDGTARMYNRNTGQALILSNHARSVFFVAELGRQNEYLSAGHDGVLRLQQTDPEAELPTIQPSNEPVVTVRWNGDESQILVTSGQAATLWQAQTGAFLLRMSHEAQVWSARWDRDESQILTSDAAGVARTWDAQSGTLLSERVQPASVPYFRTDLDGTVFISGSEDGTVIIGDVQSGDVKCELNIADDQAGTQDVAVTARFQRNDGVRMIVASANGQAQLWHIPNCEKLYDLPTGLVSAREALWNPSDRSLLLIYGNGGPPLIWQADDDELLWTLHDEAFPAEITINADWNQDESLVFTVGDDGRVRVWQMTDGALRRRLEHDGPVSSASWIDNDQILTTDERGVVQIWKVDEETPVFTVSQSSRIVGAVYQPQRNMVLTWGVDGKARLWQLPHEDEYAVLEGHTGPIVGAAFNKDATQVMTWGEDGAVRRYYVHMADLLRSACSLTAVSIRPPFCASYLDVADQPTP